MLRFSIKTLLTLMALVAFAIHTLTQPSVTVAIVIMLATVLSLISLLVLGLWKRRYLALILVCLCCGYLGVADGGMFSLSVWNLPTEKILNQHPVPQEYFADCQISSNSLFKWVWLTCVEEYRVANGMPRFKEYPKILPSFTINLANGKTIDLPTASLSVANAHHVVDSKGVLVRVVERYPPKNKPFFIIGHCWFVIVVVTFTLLVLCQKTESKNQDKNTRDAIK